MIDFFGEPLAQLPDVAPRVRKPRLESSVQAELLRELHRLPGCQAFRVSVLWSERAKRHSAPDGTPDVYVCWQGRSFWIECKSARGKPRPAQIAWRDAHVAAGGVYLVCRDVPATLAEITTARK